MGRVAKNALILHGTGGSPDDNWFQWLKNQLAWRGYEVSAPQLPGADRPNLDAYWSALCDFDFNEKTLIIGHSSGATAALGLLQRLASTVVVDHVITVAGFPWDKGYNCEELFEEPFHWDVIRAHASRFSVVWSPDDPHVDAEQTEALANELGVEPVVLEDMAHFSISTGGRRFRTLPVLLDLLRIDYPN